MRIIKATEHRALVLDRGKYYVVSSNGYETLVFPADKEGSIQDYLEVGGGRDLTVAEVLQNWYQWGPR